MRLSQRSHALLMLLMLVGLSACQSLPSLSGTTPPRERIPIAAAVPPGIPALQLQPREGESLARARLNLEEILTTLPRPVYLDSLTVAASAWRDTGAGDSMQPTEALETPEGAADAEAPSPEFLKAYIAGRLAWRAGQTAEAIHQLNTALRWSPDHPAVLSLLGKIHLLSLNQRARGVLYLEQAVAGDPQDVESLFLLGRTSWEQGQWDQAIVLLDEVTRRARSPVDPGLVVLTRHLLGAALERQGYDAAAATQFTQYLDQQSAFGRTSRYQRELLLLQRQKARLWQGVGDQYLRLGEYPAALQAYERSAELDDPEDRPALVARLAYVNLRRGTPDAAAQAVLNYLQGAPSDLRGLELWQYLRGYPMSVDFILPRLREIYHQSHRPEGLALALADVAPAAEAQTLLQEHLAYDPTAWRVFARLLSLAMQEESPRSDRKTPHRDPRLDPGLHRALHATQKAIEATPRAAGSYTQALLETVPADQVQAATVSLRDGGNRSAGLLYVLAQSALRQQQWLAAEIALREVLTQQPPIPAAPIDLVRVLLTQRQWEEAGRVLADLHENTPEIVSLRVQWLSATGQRDQALALLDQELLRQPGYVDFILAKAMLLLQTREPAQVQAAERMLLSAVETAPTQERLYQALFLIYDQQAVPHAARQRVALLRKAMQHLPAARLIRIKLAEEHLRANDLAEARRLLDNLLQDQPDDPVAVQLMLITLHRTGQPDQAQALLDRHVNDQTRDRNWLVLAQQYYTGTGQRDKALDIFERLVILEPVGPRRDLQLAHVYLLTERVAQAIALLKQTLDAWPVQPPTATCAATETSPTPKPDAALDPAIEAPPSEPADQPSLAQALGLLARALMREKREGEIDTIFEKALRRHPTQEAQVRLEWAMILQRLHQTPRSEDQLQRVLAIVPGDARAQNALGYGWADQGIRLPEAQKLVEQALVQEPENAAYLDSLGWVLYKRGEFDKAVEWLTKARMRPGGDHPVILDHLGDALWRAGRKTEALRYWQVALESILPEMLLEDPEVVQLQTELPGKIAAAVANQEPAVAPLGQGVEVVPASVPAASPDVGD